jgi:hypothetical protein
MPNDNSVGNGGGYGGFYCFSTVPLGAEARLLIGSRPRFHRAGLFGPLHPN